MLRNLKVLGLALVAVLSTGAMGVSTALAMDHFTVAGGGSALLTAASGDNVFKITSPLTEYKCATSTYHAPVLNTSTEVTVTPIYEGTPGKTNSGHCSSSLGEKVTVDMNGCDYVVTGETTGKDQEKTDATIWLTCPTGKEVELTTSLCNIFIHEQTPTEGGVVYANEVNAEGKHVVKVSITVTGITWKSEGTFTCSLGGYKEGNNSDYTGTVVMKGFEERYSYGEGGQVNAEVSEGAGGDEIKIPSQSGRLTGTGEDNVFKIANPLVEFKCKTSKLSSSISSGATEVTASPAYEGTPGETDTGHCFASIGEKFTVDMNGCSYFLTGETTKEDKADKTGKKDAVISITCPVGKEIEITNQLCNIFIHEQTPTEGGVTYTNEVISGKNVVKITVTATGITWKAEDSSTCTLAGFKEGDNGNYNGTVIVKGFNEERFFSGGPLDIEMS